jgi:hypothetical protein
MCSGAKKTRELESLRSMVVLTRLHQLDTIFTIFGAFDRDKRLILQGRGLRKRLVNGVQDRYTPTH